MSVTLSLRSTGTSTLRLLQPAATERVATEYAIPVRMSSHFSQSVQEEHFQQAKKGTHCNEVNDNTQKRMRPH
jgi:hypothetical protein